MNAIVESTQERTAVVPSPITMLQTALERGASIEQMQQLIALQERMEATQARKAYVAAMAEFKANPPEITKDKHVAYRNKTGGMTEYDHATLGAICRAVIKGLAQVQISHSWKLLQGEKQVKVTCVLTHAMGHSESVELRWHPDDSGGKNSIQAIGSVIKYLERYTLMAATGLAELDPTDDDGQGATTDGYFISEKQIHDLKALGEEVGVEKEKFLKFMKVDDIAKIPSSQYAVAVQALEDKRKK